MAAVAGPGIMSVRRAHTKSRNGCDDCKRRKVKCDETFPTCRHCARRAITCSLSTSAPKERSNLSPDGTDRSVGSSGDHIFGPAGIDLPHVSHIDLLLHRWQSRPSVAETWGHGLELMHHFSTVTADTMSHRTEMRYVWRMVFPQLAYDSSFAMQIILACSASHKAYLLPSQRQKYANLAVYHQTVGLEGFRAALADIQSHDWRHLFLVSTMVVVSINFQEAQTDHRDVSTPEALDCFVFIRGVRTLMSALQPRLGGTPLEPISAGVSASDEEVEQGFSTVAWDRSALPVDLHEALDNLEAFYSRHLTGDREVDYLKAVKELRRSSFVIAQAGTQPEVGMVMVAAYRIPDGVMKELLVMDPFAMVFLAYFTVFLRLLELRFWFLAGRPERMFEIIDAKIENLPQHREIVEWARVQVFELYGPV